MGTESYLVGKGEVYFGKFRAGTQIPEGFRLLGNCPEFTLNVEQDELTHTSSMRGIRTEDQSIIVETRLGGAVTCDEISLENLALFFNGAVSTITETSGTAVTETFTDVVKGTTLQLGITDATPAGIRKATVTGIVKGATPLVLNTDYTFDVELGLVKLLPGGTVITASTDDITVTYDRAASTRTRVTSGVTQQEGSLKFISYSPTGIKQDYTLPWAKLTANGDLALISEEWATLPLTIKALAKGSLALLYIDGRPV